MKYEQLHVLTRRCDKSRTYRTVVVAEAAGRASAADDDDWRVATLIYSRTHLYKHTLLQRFLFVVTCF